jgi:hypothetical protein
MTNLADSLEPPDCHYLLSLANRLPCGRVYWFNARQCDISAPHCNLQLRLQSAEGFKFSRDVCVSSHLNVACCGSSFEWCGALNVFE